MRIKGLLVPFLIFLTFCNSSIKSQVNPVPAHKIVFSPDSLAGFDEFQAKNIAIGKSLYGAEFLTFLNLEKRNYINTKYNLKVGEYEETPLLSQYYSGRYSPGYTSNAPCVNEGFENGTLSGWTASTGINSSSQVYPTTTTSIGASSQLTVLSTPLIDAVTGFTIPNSPLGGSKVVKIGDTQTGAVAIKLTQTFSVTATNYLYDFAYWAVMENATSHNCNETPYMLVKIRNFANTLQTCPNFSIVAPSTGSGGCAGIGPTTWQSVNGGLIMANNAWQKFSIDLTPYMSQNVTIEVIVADCSLTGHYGYAYFDSNCNTMNLTVNASQTNSQVISMPGATVYPQVLCGTNATLTAPSGLSPYVWQGPAGSGVSSNTNQTIATAVAGAYTLNMSPTGICNPPIQKVIQLSFVPPTTVTASSYNLCGSGSNTVSTLTASGASQYTWMPGGSNSSSISVSPTTTTIYTLTAQTGTCVGDFTVQINVNPDPTVQVFTSNTSLCPGQAATLTAIGANSYAWAPGGMTGSLVIVTQTAQTTYTVIGTATTGCSAPATITINQATLAPASIFWFSPSPQSTICPGTSILLFGNGATTFTWYPGGYVGNPATFNPQSTTTYTAVGSAGSCTNSATVTATVDPGPTMTVTSSPTIICPGGSATLNAVAPTAISLTWAPVSSNANSIVVTPSVSTIYTVSGTNSLGCVSRYTVSPVLSPVPSITITPATPSVCFGNSAILTASGALTYTWNSPVATGSQITVSPTVNTTYTIVGSNGTCTSSTTSSLTVVPLPTVSASSSTAQICSGQSLTLSGGGATNYTWMPGNLTGSNVTVSPTITTTYTLTGDQGGCQNTAMVTVTVNNGPSMLPSASPTAICVGGTATLTSNGAVSYTWSPGLLTGVSVTVSPPSSTIYSVTGETALACLSTATVNLVVNPLPTVTVSASSTTVCLGSSVNLSAGGASTFTWQPVNLTGANIAVSPTTTTTYTVFGTNATGCVSQTMITINVILPPVVTASVNFGTICAGNCTTLTASGATNYTWMPGSLIGSPVQVCPPSNQTYTVTGNTSGCTATATVAVTVNSSPTIIASANPATICPGGSSTITPSGAGAGGTYTINAPSFIVSPTVTTTYTVSGTNIQGCSGFTTVTVFVSPVASLTISPSSASICVGGTVSITASGSTFYSWQPGGFSGSNITALPSVTTIYTITGTSALGCTATANATVFVTPTPTVNVSPSSGTVCAGSCMSFSATGATNYTWQPAGILTATASLCPTVNTTYTVTGSTGGCAGTKLVTVNVNSAPIVGASASPNPICAGNSSTLTPSGASNYTWSPGGSTIAVQVVNPGTSTSYTVIGASAIGCTASAVVNLTVNPLPTVFAVANPTNICSGSTATLAGGGALTYTWNPGGLTGSNPTVSPSSSTTYTMFGNNGNCTNSTVVNVSVTPSPTISVSGNPLTVCPGGTSTLTGSGATNFNWSTGATGNPIVVNPTVTTVYTATGTSSSCSSAPVSVTITVNPAPSLIASASPTAVCLGNSSTLSASGASSYTWLPMNTTGATAIVSPTTTSTYTLIGSNALGCTSSTVISVVVFPAGSISAFATPTAICSGSVAVLNAIGASTYTWQPGNLSGSTVSVSPSSTTNYTVTGTNSLGCVAQTVVQLVVNPTPTITISPTPTTICLGSCITLTANGAASYTWSTLSTGSTVAVCPTVNTSYTVVGNTGNCFNFAIGSVNVTNGPTLSTSASPTAVCPGGSSTLTATGAVAYTWSPGNLPGSSIVVTPTITSTYTVQGANAQGCVDILNTYTVSVTVNPNPTVSISPATPTICSGQSILLTGSGATSYTWYPGATTGSALSVSPGSTTTYTLVGGLGSCTSSATRVVTVYPVPLVSASASQATICLGGSATLTAGGATSYTWLPGSSTVNPLVVTPSVSTLYIVAGINASGCTGTANVFVTVTNGPTLSVSASPAAICPGGSSTLTASGAVSYTWNPGNLSGSSTVVNPPATTIYTVIGANALGCVNNLNTYTVSVTVNPNPTVSISPASAAICSGQSVTLSGSGATSYTWYPGATTGSAITVSPGSNTTYTLVGGLGTCTSSATRVVSVNPVPIVSAGASPASICAGASSTLTANGATSYTWLPGSSTVNPLVVTPSVSTNYTVSGTNAFGCSVSITVSVTVNPNPVTSVSGNTSICSGSSTTLTASGATNYTWNPGGATGSVLVVSPSSTSVYTVTGANATGCSSAFSITVVVSPTPTLSVNASTNIVCAGSSVTLTASGAGGYTFNPGGVTINPAVFNPTSTTSYTVVGSNGGPSGGCNSSTVVTINVILLPAVTAAASPTNICSGGVATLTAGGALTYTWQPLNVSASTVTDSPTASTLYTVTGKDAAGCMNNATVSLIVSATPTVTAVSSSTAICIGGTATLTANGAVNYTWMPGSQTGQNITVNPTSTSTYVVTGDNGAVCTATAMVVLAVNPLPTVSASSSSAIVCAGDAVTLTAAGAVNYTWSPMTITGNPVTDNPTGNTTYTVAGADANGCINFANVTVSVNPLPVLSALATPSMICDGGTVALNASGAVSYTWNPTGSTGSSITDTPTITTTYTVSGTDAIGCIGSGTIGVAVVPNPTIVVTPLNSSVCIGSSATLTATGANNYTWLPSGNATSVTIETPTVNTTYTVVGDNAGLCFSSTTVDVFVNPLPANVGASASGTITCTSPTVDLFGTCTDTNVSYTWAGPSSFTSSVQNPTAVTIWGDFTLAVTDNVTGCVSTVTVNVPTDNSIPSVTATASNGSITCAAPVVTLNASHTTTNPAYSWIGASGFTSAVQNPSIATPGSYTITVTDLSSTCTGTAVVTVGIHMSVTAQATITPATCTNGVSNNDGKIEVSGFALSDKYDLVTGSSYTGTATYTTAVLVPTTGIITNTLANPSTTVVYTLRIFDSLGCTKDFALILIPVDCSINTLGMAKAVSEPVLNTDGSYNVTYTVVARNYDTSKTKGMLTDVNIADNLAATFPAPTTFTVVSAPNVVAGGTSLTINSNFNGNTETSITTPSLSMLLPDDSAAIVFTVKVKTPIFFTPFNNTAVGQGVNSASVTIKDSSNVGLNPDPDGDKTAANNNIPTPVTFTPNVFFGITKTGSFVKQDNNSFDVTYSITVHNLGNDTLRNVVLRDSLLGLTVKQPASYTIKSAPAVIGSGLVANNSYNGGSDPDLVNSSVSKMNPGTVSSVVFVINVVPDTVSVLINSASGSAMSAVSSTLSMPVTDISNDGTSPDSNHNGVWNEPADNVPTVLMLPSTATLFIPEGFSPNDDGINDVFVIKGLPTTGENALTIFNRWGNRVYYHANYGSGYPWDGRPNIAGTLGKDRLPPGTYYYILEMKGSGQKPITGFIVLQY